MEEIKAPVPPQHSSVPYQAVNMHISNKKVCKPCTDPMYLSLVGPPASPVTISARHHRHSCKPRTLHSIPPLSFYVREETCTRLSVVKIQVHIKINNESAFFIVEYSRLNF